MYASQNSPSLAACHSTNIEYSVQRAFRASDSSDYIPAHLEYHDNEKRWREGGIPNKDIILKHCFNICRKRDGAGINNCVITVVSTNDNLDIIFEKEQDMLIWLDLLVTCQKGGRPAQGRIVKPIYEYMWEVNIKRFKSEKSTASKGFQMAGPRRLVATENTFKFFELGSDQPITFAYKDIKGHKSHNRNYIIQTGTRSPSGRGQIEIDCKDNRISDQIYETVGRKNDFLFISFQLHYLYFIPCSNIHTSSIPIFCSFKCTRRNLLSINMTLNHLDIMTVFTID